MKKILKASYAMCLMASLSFSTSKAETSDFIYNDILVCDHSVVENAIQEYRESLIDLVNDLPDKHKVRVHQILNILESYDELNINFTSFDSNNKSYVWSNLNQSDLYFNLNLDNRFDFNNIIDVSNLMHELFHVAQILYDSRILSSSDWRVLYFPFGNVTEVRTELEAWRFQLDFLNFLTHNSLLNFANSLSGGEDPEELNFLKNEFVNSFSYRYAIANEDSIMVLEKLLALQISILENSECRESDFSNQFAIIVASDYIDDGNRVYELIPPNSEENSYNNKCIISLRDFDSSFSFSNFEYAFAYVKYQEGVYFKNPNYVLNVRD